MSDELALLTAIIAYPDEDTPRLIFADWLQENGQPERAEFIRVQIEVTRLPERDRKTPHYRERLTRFRELIVAHRDGWVKPLAVAPTQVVFRRGFIEELRALSGQLVSIGDAVLCREVLSSLEVTAPRDADDAAFGDPTGRAVLRAPRVVAGARTAPEAAPRRTHTGAGRGRSVREFGAGVGSARVGHRRLRLRRAAGGSRAGRVRESDRVDRTSVGSLRVGSGRHSRLGPRPHLKKLRTVGLHVTGLNDPETPTELRAAISQLHKRYPIHQPW